MLEDRDASTMVSAPHKNEQVRCESEIAAVPNTNRANKDSSQDSRAAVLLAGVAEAARRLLAIADFDAAVNGALAAIATSADIDRIFIFRHHSATNATPEFATCPYEWTASNIPVTRTVPGRFPMVYSDIEGFSEWVQALKAGESVQKLKQEMSVGGQALQDIDQALSVLTVPIFIEGEYWGNFGFDDCTTERVWSETEIAVLETAAACIGSAIERDRTQKARMAETEAHNQTLAERDRILEATAAAANVILLNDDFERAVNEALKIVGEGLSVDRASLGKYYSASSEAAGYHLFEYEWASSGIAAQKAHPELSKISDEGLEYAVEALQRGEVFGGVVEELNDPFRSAQMALGVISTYAIPITVDNGYWGLIGFDDCHRKTHRSEAELEALKTLANCIGSAIERDQIRAAREAAERAAIVARERAARADELEAANKVLSVRDKWLQTTAAAANELLSTTDVSASVKAALATMGENLECDRLGVMRYLPADAADAANVDSLGYFRVLYEWDASGIVNQLETDELSVMPASDFADWSARLMAGEAVGGKIAEQAEPFRSKMRSLGVLCAYAVPIFAGTAQKAGFWGLMFVDYCQQMRQLSLPELAIFRTAASCVGSAIYQSGVRKDKVERAVLEERAKAARDRAAQLSRSNRALKHNLDSLAQQPELDAFLQGVISEATAQTGAESGHLFLYDADTRTCRLHASTDNNGDWRNLPDMSIWLQPISVDEAPLFWEKMFERKAFVWEDMQSTLEPGPHVWEISIDWHLQRGHTSAICAPLLLGDQILGFFGLAFVGETSFTQEDVELAQALTNQATLAIQFTRLADDAKQTAILQEQEKAARDRATELAKANEAIGKTLSALTETPEPTEFLGRILNTICRSVDACKAHLFLYDEATDTLRQHIAVHDGVAYQFAAPGDPDIFRRPVPANLTGAWQAIVSSDRPFTLDERRAESAELFWPETVPWHEEQGHLSATCACMRVGDKPIGFIGFAFRYVPVLTDEQLEFIQALTNQATLSIHLTRLADDARQAAILQEQERAARERVAELAKTNEALGQTLSVLTTTPKLDDFLGQVLCKISEPVQACKALLFLYDEDTHALHAHLSVHDWQHVYQGAAPNDPEMFRYPIPADISPAWSRIVSSSKPWMLEKDNPADADLWWPDSLPWNRAEGHCAAICAVMKVGGNPIGFIALTFRSIPDLTDEQLEFIQSLTNQATLAIHLTRLAEQRKTAALSAALTEERNRLAREIHDTLAQAFTGISLQLEAGKNLFNVDVTETYYHIERAGEIAREGLAEARRSVQGLRSQALVASTLPEALRTTLEEMTQDSATRATLQVMGTPCALPENMQTNLLRIGQEATTNALRHAHAETLTLKLVYEPNRVCLQIADDGQGSNITSLDQAEGFGLLGMRERTLRFSGKFYFTSIPGKGTTIDVTIPIRL